MVVYFRCTTNNTVDSVFSYFWNATRVFGIPSRVRSDKGGQNVRICYFMISQRGPGCGSHIAGPSTHNQCIERLWRDVYRCVSSTYHEVFYLMEAQQILDPEMNCICSYYIACFFHKLIVLCSHFPVPGIDTHFVQKECGPLENMDEWND